MSTINPNGTTPTSTSNNSGVTPNPLLNKKEQSPEIQNTQVKQAGYASFKTPAVGAKLETIGKIFGSIKEALPTMQEIKALTGRLLPDTQRRTELKQKISEANAFLAQFQGKIDSAKAKYAELKNSYLEKKAGIMEQVESFKRGIKINMENYSAHSRSLELSKSQLSEINSQLNGMADSPEKHTLQGEKIILENQIAAEEKVVKTFKRMVEDANGRFATKEAEVKRALESLDSTVLPALKEAALELLSLRQEWKTEKQNLEMFRGQFAGKAIELSKKMELFDHAEQKINDFFQRHEIITSHDKEEYKSIRSQLEEQLSGLKNFNNTDINYDETLRGINEKILSLEEHKNILRAGGNTDLANEIDRFISQIKKDPLISDACKGSSDAIHAASTKQANIHAATKKMIKERPDLRSAEAQSELKSLQEQNKAFLQGAMVRSASSQTYARASDINLNNVTNQPQPVNSQALDVKLMKVQSELKTLEKHLGSDHPELKGYTQALQNSLDVKSRELMYTLTPGAENALIQDLNNMTAVIGMIEAEMTHREEMQATVTPQRVALKELALLKDVIASATQNDSKLRLKTSENGESWIDTKNRSFGLLALQGTSKNAEAAVNHILNKLSNNSLDANLHETIKGVLTAIEKNLWIQATIEANPELKARVDSILINVDSTKGNTVIPKREMDAMNELLTPPGNEQFEEQFLLSYRTTIKDITGNRDKSVSDSAKLFEFFTQKLSDPQLSLFGKQQILKLADKWINDPKINNYEVSKFEQEILSLANIANKSNSPSLKQLSQKLLSSLESAKSIIAPSAVLTDGTKSVTNLIDAIARGDIKPGDEAYTQAVKEFAGSLTSRAESIFKSITSSEFKDAKWNANKEGAPNISRMIIEFNTISQFVTESVLSPLNTNEANMFSLETRQEQSARVMEFFIGVQETLISPDNHSVDINSFMAIQSSLVSSSIARLKNTKANLTESIQKTFQKHDELVSNSFNFRNLRELMRTEAPIVPYLGLLLTDITFATEGNPEKVNDQVNANRIVLIGQSINGVIALQESISPTEAPVYQLSDVSTTGQRFTEDGAYNRSLELEPRAK